MQKPGFVLCFILLLAFAQAQEPALPAGIQSFIPKGWIVLQKATGDLNKDNQQDLALVIQDTDKKNILINHELGVDTLDANPRSLMVFFKDSLAGGYHLVTKNDSFILKHDDPVMDLSLIHI